MKKFVLMAVAAIMFCSCSALTHVTTPQTVALNQGNFRFVGTVTADVPALYVFGIGGMSKNATSDVFEKLRVKAQLRQNQALADIRIKTTTKVWFLGAVVTRTLTATASVVEFCDVETGSYDTNALNEVSASAIVKPIEGYTREYALERLSAIDAFLSDDSSRDFESLMMEVNHIDEWYEGINEIYPDVKRELNKVKKHIRTKL